MHLNQSKKKKFKLNEIRNYDKVLKKNIKFILQF